MTTIRATMRCCRCSALAMALLGTTVLILLTTNECSGFIPPGRMPLSSSSSSPPLTSKDWTLPIIFSSNSDNDDTEAERLRRKAEELRDQIRQMEASLPQDRQELRQRQPSRPPTTGTATISAKTPQTPLAGARILVVGANGRLGSMVCRYLLRECPEIQQVVAAVHVVGENSSTARGYGRLSYEVGAEDGVGSIGPAWSSAEERTATFEFDVETMTDYNLQKMRIVECELLDPVQCQSIVQDSEADTVIWCATDYNGNRPRAVSGLNVAFLFRALADPTKGRVEVEGLQNMLGAIKTARQETLQRNRLMMGGGNNVAATKDDDDGDDDKKKNKPVDIMLVSMAPNALGDFETPFGTFYDVKRQGEVMIANDFPSLTYTILQMGQFDDNFVDEGLELQFGPAESSSSSSRDEGEIDPENVTTPLSTQRIGRRRINRRDAARAVAVALNRPDLKGTKVQVWTNEVG